MFEPTTIQHARTYQPRPKPIRRYGREWEADDPLRIDLELLRHWPKPAANPPDLIASWTEEEWFAVHKAALTAAFPSFVHHRWSDWMIRGWVQTAYLGVMGAASSGKTYVAAALTLLAWYCDPENTFALTSSTSLAELKRRVLGVIFDLHREAQIHHPWLPGREVTGENGIYLIGADGKPNLRRGVMGLATVSSSGEPMKGIRGIGQKAPRVFHLADEYQLMTGNFISASANLAANPIYMLRALGNPTSIDDPLGAICAPVQGWSSLAESSVARSWKTKSGLAIQLPGLDTPNGDAEPPGPFVGILTKRFIEETRLRFGESDIRYRCFALGAIPSSAGDMVVADRILVLRMQADQPPKFAGPVRHFAGLDPAFGGGDRCIAVFCSAGPDPDGQMLIAMDASIVIPVEASNLATKEEGIALAYRLECERRQIPPHQAGYDSTFSSIAPAIGRAWSVNVLPVMFSGLPVDPDPALGEAELTLQDYPPSERFGKRVTQIVWRVREAIETGCVRSLAEDVILELSRRRWQVTSRTGAIMKMDVETKQEYKGRHGDSPDYADALAVCFEVMTRNGVRLRPIRSDRDEAVSLAAPPPFNAARGVDSAEDDALLERLQRLELHRHTLNTIVRVTGIPHPKPPPNRALVSEVRWRTQVEQDPLDEELLPGARAREAVRAMNRAFHEC